jgi:CRP-like cAMP-binding protein
MDPKRNLILAALPDDERDGLIASGRAVTLLTGDIPYEQDALVEHVYFPTSGAVSVLIAMEDGRALEAALIGREGVLGFPIGLGDNRSRWRSIVQLPGEALVLRREEVSAHLRRPGNLAALLGHYAGLLTTFAAQSAACTQFHPLAQRTARWLLTMHDRAGADEFAITQDFLAYMLGTHRPSETLALGELRDLGLIGLSRGLIRIRDRKGLQAAACECYDRIARDFYGERVAVGRDVSVGEGRPYDPTNWESKD